jgi:hypothetical protein
MYLALVLQIQRALIQSVLYWATTLMLMASFTASYAPLTVTITTFDAPGAGTNPNQGEGTFPFGINPQGTITGFYRRVWKSSPESTSKNGQKRILFQPRRILERA